ncbi:MAG: type II secretion system minor pseudopilin GspK [Gammaproteobacteria bacterium]|nr:type II secretion system minor pseudopilin GspK [Gammaproteobacteria bacterium]
MSKVVVPPNQRIRQQSGLALVSVLLVVALISSLQIFLVEQQHLLIRRISNQNAAEQGYQYAQGLNSWAIRVLAEDEEPAIDYWREDWYRLGRPEPLKEEGAQGFSLQTTSQAESEQEPLAVIDFGVEGLNFEIVDLQGRFNLNNLQQREPAAAKAQQTVLMNLLEILDIGEFEERESLVAALIDWLDENDLARANGVESAEYQIGEPPYYAADQALTSVGELRFVAGFTDQIIARLEPYVTVLPASNVRININTTSAEVLAALSSVPVDDIAPVAAFLGERDEEAFQGFQSADIQRAENAIISASVLARTPLSNMLQINSQFFAVNSRITLGDYRYCMRTKLVRMGALQGAGTPAVSVIGREYDTFCAASEEAEV